MSSMKPSGEQWPADSVQQAPVRLPRNQRYPLRRCPGAHLQPSKRFINSYVLRVRSCPVPCSGVAYEHQHQQQHHPIYPLQHRWKQRRHQAVPKKPNHIQLILTTLSHGTWRLFTMLWNGCCSTCFDVRVQATTPAPQRISPRTQSTNTLPRHLLQKTNPHRMPPDTSFISCRAGVTHGYRFGHQHVSRTAGSYGGSASSPGTPSRWRHASSSWRITRYPLCTIWTQCTDARAAIDGVKRCVRLERCSSPSN